MPRSTSAEREPGADGKPSLAVNARSKRAAVLLPAPSRMFDDGGVQERVRLVRPATRETMARPELDASNWRRTDEAQWRTLWEHEIAELPSHRESRFWLAAGLLLPIWDRLPFENMRVRRLTTDDGEALIGRVLDAEQVRAARASFGLDGGPAMTGEEAFEAVMGRGTSLPLANGWRLARRCIRGADRVEIEGPPTPTSACSGASAARWRSSRTAPAHSRPPRRCSTASSNDGRSPPEPPQPHTYRRPVRRRPVHHCPRRRRAGGTCRRPAGRGTPPSEGVPRHERGGRRAGCAAGANPTERWRLCPGILSLGRFCRSSHGTGFCGSDACIGSRSSRKKPRRPEILCWDDLGDAAQVAKSLDASLFRHLHLPIRAMRNSFSGAKRTDLQNASSGSCPISSVR